MVGLPSTCPLKIHIQYFDLIASFVDIQMFDAKYCAMDKGQMHADEIITLLYGFAPILAITHSLKLIDYLLVQTHKPYNNI